MTELFGDALRRLRTTEGLRQADLAQILGLARSTVANVERNGMAPTARLWQAIREARPAWAEDLTDLYGAAREDPPRPALSRTAATADQPYLGGPFKIESVSYGYLFEVTRSPSEIIEVRRIRALKSTAAFGLHLRNTETPGFRVDQEVLWGGELTDVEVRDGHETNVWTRLEFGRRLRRGDRHEFALRTWIDRDPEPPTSINCHFSIPTSEASIHLTFRGATRPSAVWSYGPIAHEKDAPEDGPDEGSVAIHGTRGAYTARFLMPQLAYFYGVCWKWA